MIARQIAARGRLCAGAIALVPIACSPRRALGLPAAVVLTAVVEPVTVELNNPGAKQGSVG